jgi:hypothetical protein
MGHYQNIAFGLSSFPHFLTAFMFERSAQKGAGSQQKGRPAMGTCLERGY